MQCIVRNSSISSRSGSDTMLAILYVSNVCVIALMYA